MTFYNYSLCNTKEPCLSATPLLLPCYYDHLILAWTKVNQSFYLKNHFNTATPLIRPDFCGAFVTRLTSLQKLPKKNKLTLYYSYWNSTPSKIFLPQVREVSILKARTEFVACYSLHVNNCDSVFMITWEIIINFSSSFRWDPQCAIHLAAIFR